MLAFAVFVALVSVPCGGARLEGGSPVALVTAETANEVGAVSLPGGTVLRRVHLHDPQTIVAGAAGPAVVVSPSTASLLNGDVSEFAGPTLARWMTVKLAPETRDLAISVWRACHAQAAPLS